MAENIRIVDADPSGVIELGMQGEKNATRVVFDCSDLAQSFGTGEAELAVMNPKSCKTYVAKITQDGSSVRWDIGTEWTQTAGYGECQLSWFVGGVLAKSIVYTTHVKKSLGEGTHADSPEPGYVESVHKAGKYAEQAEEAADRAESAKEAVENLGVSAVTGEPGGEASVVKTVNADGTVTLQFTLPRGQQGPQGVQGPQGPEGPEGERGPRGHIGPEGPEGPQGPRGYNGTNGKDGLDGYTPVRGVDYWTPTDRSEIVAQVLAALPNGDDTEYPEANTFAFTIDGDTYEAVEGMTWREWVASEYCPTWPCPDCGYDERLFVAWEDRACVCKLTTCSEGPWYNDRVTIVCGDNDEDTTNTIEGRDYWLREVCSNCWNETCSCDEENGYDGPSGYGTCACGEPLDENGNCTVMQGPICNGWVEE